MKSYLMLQIAKFINLTFSELFLGKPRKVVKIPSPQPRLALKCSVIFNMVEVGNVNSQHI